MISQDPEIQYCVSGRDLSQITGEDGAATQARFPNLLNQIKMQIAVSALRQAQDNSFTGLGTNRVKVDLPSGTREMWSVFNRDTRTCHYCTSTITKSCESVSKKGFLGIGATDELKCTESEPVEKCEDIVM